MSDLATQLAQLKAHESWAKTKDRTKRTQNGRQAALDAIAATVDPDGEMSEEDRQKAVQNAISAHYRRMAIRSAEVRRNKAAGVGA